MRTVLVSYAFPPLSYPRSIQVAHLAANSRLPDLAVVTSENPPEAADPDLLRLVAGTKVTRIPWPSSGRLMRRLPPSLSRRLLVPDDFRPWARAAARAIVREGSLGPEDLVVSFGQPMSDHLAGLEVAERTGVTWIAHFSDPWVDNPYSSSPARAAARSARLEAAVASNADLLVFTSSDAAEAMTSRYPAALRDKSAVLPHAYDPSTYPDAAASPGRMVIGRYIGSLYGIRRPKPLLEGLARLRQEEPEVAERLRIELLGTLDADARREAEAARLPPGLVTVRPPVGYVAALAAMRSAGFLIVIDAPGRRSVFLPSKLIEYIGARRPIVAISPPGPSASVVRELGGWHADPGDPAAIAEVLREATAAAAEPEWGDDELVRRYTAESVAARFDELAGIARERRSDRVAERA